MRIVHLLGNGFDINLNIETRYPDFYQYYRSVHSDNEIINLLKEEIESDWEYWADMEKAFGKHTSLLKSQDELDIVVRDIAKNLGEYLKKQEDKFDYKKVDKRKVHNYLANPENILSPTDKIKVTHFKRNFSRNTWLTNVITFNYTRVLERMLEDNYNNVAIGTHHNNSPNTLSNIDHIHGYTNERLIFGLNDTSQIGNADFHHNPDVEELIVKSSANRACKTNVDNRVTSLIKNANLICIFGSSIGETDKCWWELIGDCLKKDIRLIIFDRDPDIDNLLPQTQGRTERKIIKNFLSKTKLEKKEREAVKEKIIVSINSSMFNDVYL